MLFHVQWAFTDQSEEGSRRSLDVFSKWQPPPGADFQGFYGFADGSGGVAIVEVDSAATLARTTGPWTPWLTFEVTPILPIDESSSIGGERGVPRLGVVVRRSKVRRDRATGSRSTERVAVAGRPGSGATTPASSSPTLNAWSGDERDDRRRSDGVMGPPRRRSAKRSDVEW